MLPLLTTDNAVQLDARFVASRLLNEPFNRSCTLRWKRFDGGESTVTSEVREGPVLLVQLPAEFNNLSYKIPLHYTTACGNSKHWWFTCPGCFHHRRILYWLHDSDELSCRVCLGLRYPSEFFRGSSDVERLWRRLYQVRKFGGDPGIEWHDGDESVAPPCEISNGDRSEVTIPIAANS